MIYHSFGEGFFVRLGGPTGCDRLNDLTTLLDLLQSVPAGSPTLDALIHRVLANSAFGKPGIDEPVPSARWSEDLTALLRFVPSDHNFSLGERDGVLWAWIQPNDDWGPEANEMRHDHPRGSGLIVACTLPLAMAAALVALRNHAARRPNDGARDEPGAA
jgi:hypothetical protein